MAGQSRKWMILVATIWIQAFTGTNFDFSAYSSEMKAVLGVSQVQLSYLATASDLGKLFGWSSGLALMYLPLWMVMFIAAFMGLVGYGLQWLVIQNVISLPYFVVFLLCLLAGCSICWFNTVCFVLCIKNFPSNRPLALSLTVSFNGVSAAFYTLAAKAIYPYSSSFYLLLNALVPLFTSLVALLPILRQPPVDPLSPDAVKRDQLVFIMLNFLAVVTGLYFLFLHSSYGCSARLIFSGAIGLLLLPLGIPGIIYARRWFHHTIYSNIRLNGSGFILVDDDDLELHKELLLSRQSSLANGVSNVSVSVDAESSRRSLLEDSGSVKEDSCCCSDVIMKGKLAMLGEEHSASMLVKRLDFWLYYFAYFCGGTIGLVYSNNLGQISQSLGLNSMNSILITLYSSFSFFGRLLSATPDFIRAKFYFARPGWLAIALLPTPVAFLLLAVTGSNIALQIATALIGLSSGFIFAAAVSITSELFGPNNVGVNHNILITNIPIGSLLYGVLAAIVYDASALSGSGSESESGIRSVINSGAICMGRDCYFYTFVTWGCLSVLGLLSSLILFLRTRHVYQHFEHNRVLSSL